MKNRAEVGYPYAIPGVWQQFAEIKGITYQSLEEV